MTFFSRFIPLWVFIFNQDLEESAKNGIIKNYNITCLNTDTGRMESFIETKSQLSAKLTLASRNSFEIILTPGTSKGFSRSSSSLFLPSIQESKFNDLVHSFILCAMLITVDKVVMFYAGEQFYIAFYISNISLALPFPNYFINHFICFYLISCFVFLFLK